MEGADAAVVAALTPDRLDAVAIALAHTHRDQPRLTGSRRDVLRSLAANRTQLIANYRATVRAAESGGWISPAGEWLLDNFHVITEQLREARENLPVRFYRQLPEVATATGEREPRAFAITAELINSTDGLLDVARLTRFLDSYQTVTELTMGELWAIPIALRHGFLDRLAKIAARVDIARSEREAAAKLADELARIAATATDRVAEGLRQRVSRRTLPSTTMFATELAFKLRDRHPVLALANEWLAQRIASQGTTLEEAIRAEHRSQGFNQVTVGNCITSMRTITATNWNDVVERLSVVERILLTDPAATYARMEFATRDRYRHAIERIGHRSPLSESAIAAAAIDLAKKSGTEGIDARRAHVGYHLIERGVAVLETFARYRSPLLERLRRFTDSHATFAYLFAVIDGTLVASGFLAWVAYSLGASIAVSVVLAVVTLIPASELAIAIVNLFVTSTRAPRSLPKLDYSDGIPLEQRTLVVVPMMLTRPDAILEAVEALELRFLANQDDALRFALLSDYPDAPTRETPHDAEVLSVAEVGITRLNERHGQRFYLLHRERVWSESEQTFMGWERKRGKLAELNRLLLEQSSGVLVTVGDADHLKGTRFVITLDADTQLPLSSAARLVAAAAHPLNRPRLDEHTGIVVEGHGILQPRVSASPASVGRSLYTRIYADQEGVDPYTSAVSDVYQDLFDEGSFVGKGIYDVHAFTAALGGAIPESSVLSHDLLEGLYARAGLVSDIELFDDTPSHFLVESLRRHRWTRGDWQIMAWLHAMPRARGPSVRLSALSRWKIFDNLRRTLVAPFSLLGLLVGWCALSGSGAWTASMLLLSAMPVWAHGLAALARPPRHASYMSHLRRVLVDSSRSLLRAAIGIAFTPFEAWTSVDAIGRALYRRYVSHRHLLQWMTAAQAEHNAERGLGAFYRTMGPALTFVCALYLLVFAISGLRALESLPLLVSWLLAPAIAYRLSLPLVPRIQTVSAVARYFLRRTARKTWRFFSVFVSREDNYLPPDNFQEAPTALVAHRTSPTNLGLALLTNLTAFDLGYIGRIECIERIERALASMGRLEKYRGHFLNWYDTKSLASLTPRYVSMVDSGNLAAMLVALQQGCLGLIGVQHSDALVDGFVDVLRLVDEALVQPRNQGNATLRLRVSELEKLLGEMPKDLAERSRWLDELRVGATSLRDEVDKTHEGANGEGTRSIDTWVEALVAQIVSQQRDLVPARTADERLRVIAATADQLVAEMDFTFLYQPQRQVFSIGYDVAANRLDASFYDLLASESRIGSFVAIAKGDVPARHWYKLGRPLTRVGHERALLSWTGTMFEYLMPNLLLRNFPNTLLDETAHAVVDRQIAYGEQRHVPWGISESAYNARDLQLNYQYGPFGVPGLGLKRGLAEDLVVAPYATALALAIDPKAAVDNMWRLVADGLDSDLGFCESIDYTPSRVPEGQRGAIVHTFMAHHQGMSLVAIAEYLCGRRMSERFHADPRVRSTELLLRERIPYDAPLEGPPPDSTRKPRPANLVSHELWKPFDVNLEPEVALHSNGNYAVMVSAAGGGYSRRRDLAVTRWREDPTRDHSGSFIYLRDVSSPGYWSATHQPVLAPARESQVCFSVDRAEWKRFDGDIVTHLAISVSMEDDAETRVITVANQSNEVRELELTSYVEVVLTTSGADAAHPAFAKLFVETEKAPSPAGLLASRRPRATEDTRIWGIHVCAVDGEAVGTEEVETSRENFLGRGRSTRSPAAMDGRLSGALGAVIDPIFSIRRRVRLAPGKSARIAFTTAVADNKELALRLAEKYSTVDAAERASALAWTQAQSQLHYLDIGLEDTRLYLRVAAKLLYASRSLRAHDELVASNRRGQSALWAHGISGDLPIVLVRVDGDEQVGLVREVLRAHEYWRMRGLAVDLVILNEHPPTYLLELDSELLGVVRSSPSASLIDKPGGIFLRRADVISPEDRTLLQSVARVQLIGARGNLAAQVDLARPVARLSEPFVLKRTRLEPSPALRAEALLFDNGFGGFSSDGKEYVIRLEPGRPTPAPWSNVLANASFGSLVTESGAGYEWAENSHENRLTEWMNDPVCDPVTSAFYVRDEQTGAYFSPTPLPVRSSAPFVVRHGQGYSRFQSTVDRIEQDLTVYVTAHDPVKVSRLTLKNTGPTPRKLSVTGYVEWTLGVLRADSAPHVVTRMDDETGAFFARNTYPNDLGSRIAFVDMVPRARTVTGDRTEFLGRYGDPAEPAAMRRVGLSNRVGAGYDPCAALQAHITLAPGESKDVVVILGQVIDEAYARSLVGKYRQPQAPADQLGIVVAEWEQRLTAIEVKTPDPGLDLIVNRWLLYQVMSSRLWARTGLYQSGGAYGFRDQLQDVASLVYSQPKLAREHILRASAHQFPEGDVLHWWHPPSDKGVRTLFADDYLWLPFIVSHYLRTTGDDALLDEQAGFVEARALEPGEHEAYLSPTRSALRGSVYEHCVRALDRSMKVGEHGLPLMGCGDWNDGMNRVGAGGKGESVWMAWFLIAVIEHFSPTCEARGDTERASLYRSHAAALKQSAEEHAWDGDWYLRAFFDDGTPLGSSKSEECQLDSLSQSWSVISGAGDKARSLRGLQAVETRLVDKEHRLVKLLTPAFDKTPHDPGYIKGYVPGVRENGGQYTHAAAWVVLAEALLGRGNEAATLLADLNPVHLGADAKSIARYRVEPYVVAADVWSLEPQAGRGGWTWYTGSASWMYRVAVESILGLTVEATSFTITPCVSASWAEFSLRYRREKTLYEIHVTNPTGAQAGVASITLDGKSHPVGPIAYIDDGGTHRVEVVMGTSTLP